MLISPVTCNGCTLDLATIGTEWYPDFPEYSTNSQDSQLVVIRSLSVTSNYVVKESCITDSNVITFSNGDLIRMQGPAMIESTIPPAFSSKVFGNVYLPRSTCVNGVTARIVLHEASSVHETAEPSSTPTSARTTAIPGTSHVSDPDKRKTMRILLGALVPAGGIGCFVLVAILLRYRRTRQKLGQNSQTTEVQPYLQPKTELGDEDHRLFEVDGNNAMQELQVPDSTPEITSESRTDIVPSLRLRHELVGEEFAKELEGVSMH